MHHTVTCINTTIVELHYHRLPIVLMQMILYANVATIILSHIPRLIWDISQL